MPEDWLRVFESDVLAYDALSRAEDAGGRILAALRSQTDFRGKSVLELGPGTGKYTEALAPSCAQLASVDASAAMVAFTRLRCRSLRNVTVLWGTAEALPFRDDSVDAVFASWVVSGLIPDEAIARAVREAMRVLRRLGRIWLVENDSEGEFMEMRDPESARWDRRHVASLLDEHGFSKVRRVETEFRFPDEETAIAVAGGILGPHARSWLHRHRTSRFGHEVLLLSRTKA